MPAGVGVPSGSSITGAVGDYAYGAAGGIVYHVVTRFAGSSLIGSAAAAVVAGSVVKGTRGEVIATIAGFQAAGSQEIQGLLANIPLIGGR